MDRQVWHVEQNRVLLARVRWCNSFGSKLRGFTFRKTLGSDEGLVLVEKGESRGGTAVHMLFVFFELAIIWLDSNGKIVDLTLAKPWRPAYMPSQPAQYVLETNPALLTQLQPGDHLQFRAL